ncbi:MAG: methyltransferase domain-containing protein [Deltaproteobacteria bacterium]|nr:methyltransferase domain-containing protein [Deltaproteobacteria bacterium]
MSTYPFDQAWDKERSRLGGLEQGLDPGTIHHLEALGIGPGWSCWEVGGGAGSIAAWMCQRVGDHGHVLATDLETTFLEQLSYPNLAVRRHDIVGDELPVGGPFDLVHARWLLHWIPDRRRALARMVAALRPSGWLLIEEPDWVTLFHACPSEIIRKVVTLLWGSEGATVDSEYGRRLFDDVRALGLLDIESSGRVEMMRSGSPLWTHLRLSIAKSPPHAIESGALTVEEVEEALAQLNDPDFATMSAITMAVWGRRLPGGSEGRR